MTAQHSAFGARAWAALGLLAVLPTAAQAVFAPGNNARSLTHDAELRVYNVYAPAGYTGA